MWDSYESNSQKLYTSVTLGSEWEIINCNARTLAFGISLTFLSWKTRWNFYIKPERNVDPAHAITNLNGNSCGFKERCTRNANKPRNTAVEVIFIVLIDLFDTFDSMPSLWLFLRGYWDTTKHRSRRKLPTSTSDSQSLRNEVEKINCEDICFRKLFIPYVHHVVIRHQRCNYG